MSSYKYGVLNDDQKVMILDLLAGNGLFAKQLMSLTHDV